MLLLAASWRSASRRTASVDFCFPFQPFYSVASQQTMAAVSGDLPWNSIERPAQSVRYLLSKFKGVNECRINVTSKNSKAANVVNRAAAGGTPVSSSRRTRSPVSPPNMKSRKTTNATAAGRTAVPIKYLIQTRAGFEIIAAAETTKRRTIREYHVAIVSRVGSGTIATTAPKSIPIMRGFHLGE